MTGLNHDLALAGRRLIQAPGLTALVVATLALGIGCTTTVFALVDAFVLAPLPFPEADRLVVLRELRADGSTLSPSYPNFLDWQARARSFAHLAIHGTEPYPVQGEKDLVPCAMVSAEYFAVLGLEPALGRTFTPAEAAPPGASVALVSHAFWQRRFQGDPGAVGQTIEVHQIPLRIVGVLPRGFRGIDPEAHVFVPVGLFDRLHPVLRSFDVLGDRHMHWGRVVGRLAPGVGPERARADLRTVASRIAAAHPDGQAANGIDLAPARESLAGPLRPPLLRLLGAVALVLLIACANVGHLLLTRAAERDREMAVRAALGATRGGLVRLWLLEGLLLGLAGGAAGLLLAVWGLDLLLAFLPLDLPAAIEVGFGWPVLAFALGISLLASLLAGLVPALHAAWPDLAESLKQGGRGATESPARRRTRQLLVTADLALALVLLIGAGLMLRSLERILRYDPGFRSDGVLTLSFEPPSHLSSEERVRLKREILATAEALPGVRSAALTSHIVFDSLLTWEIATEGRPRELARVQTFYISSAYFQTLGIPLERGRGFTAEDHRRPMRTVIVNRALAERSWPGSDPLDRWLSIGLPDQDNGENIRQFRVIGVAGNVRTAIEPGAPREPLQMYLPALEESYWGTRLVVAARDGDAAALAPDVLRALREIDPELAVFNVAPLADRVARATAATRFFTALLGLFAALALVLAVLGIYGLIAYAIQRQSREIAIRRLLGAGPWEVLRLLVARALGPALLGIALGVGGALALSRTLSTLLFDIAPLDPPTFLAVPLLFAAAVLAASLVSAQKALEIEPAVVLRDEA